MRLGSLFVLLFLNIVWLPLEANGYPDEVQNPCKDDDCGSHSSVHVNDLTVNIFPGLRNSVSDLPPALRQLLGGLTATKNCNSTQKTATPHIEEDGSEELETTFDSGEVTDAPGPRDDRPGEPCTFVAILQFFACQRRLRRLLMRAFYGEFYWCRT